jgi:hypothetical protein
LGPVLFSIYISPLSHIICAYNLHHHSYADDTQIFSSFHASDLNQHLNHLQLCLSDIKAWLFNNKLSLNESKTEFIIFGTTPQLRKLPQSFHLNIGSTIISPSISVRDLGVTLDQNLSLNYHVNNLVKSSFLFLRQLGHIRKYLDQKSAFILANSFVLSRLDFCNSLFTTLSDSNIHRLQRVQNTAARIIAHLPKRSHISSTLAQLHWLPIKFRIRYKILLLTYKSLSAASPSYLSQLLVPYTPSRLLRSTDSSLLATPDMSLEISRSSFSHLSPTLWNALPLSLRHNQSLSAFKSSLKTLLFQSAFSPS